MKQKIIFYSAMFANKIRKLQKYIKYRQIKNCKNIFIYYLCMYKTLANISSIFIKCCMNLLYNFINLYIYFSIVFYNR